jgi:choline kinase/predicted transcriptional regulator
MLEINFKILKEIKNNNLVTQRELAKKVDVSLGKINSLLKEFNDQGYIKKVSKNNRAIYEITKLGEEVLIEGLNLVMKTKLSINEKNERKSYIREAVILAAGSQKDFNKPIGSLEIENETIIDRIIKKLYKYGIEKIIVITGYERAYLKNIVANYKNVIEVYNKNYNISGTMKSLACAENKVSDDFILIESDLLFEDRALKSVLDNMIRDCVLITDISGIGDEAFVEIRNDYLYKISKDIHQFNRIDGELVGISKISFNLFNLMLNEFKENENKFVNYEYILLDVSRKYDIGYVKINDLIWGEVDNISQYEKIKKDILPLIKKSEDEEIKEGKHR